MQIGVASGLPMASYFSEPENPYLCSSIQYHRTGRMKTNLFQLKNLPWLSLLIILLMVLRMMFVMHHWTVNEDGRRGVIKWDVISYYSYLPATVIYGDPTLSFLDDREVHNDNKFWYSKLENGNRLIITSMGLSYLYAPFFLTAHALAPVLGQGNDGYSNIYQLMLIVSGVFYAFLGLVLLIRFLRRYFDPVSTAIVILVLGIGTNLYFYTTMEPAMPHSHNFFLVTLFLTLVVRWYDNPRPLNTILLGGVFGLIVLVRPTNILLFLFFFLFGVTTWRSLGERILFFLNRWPLILLMLVMFLVPWTPQMLYWKKVTGHFFFFTYSEKNASFFFGHPHILESLFSFRKGWLIYTPVMWFALAGIWWLFRKSSKWAAAVLIFVAAMIYVQSSWWCWWFGGGFSLRPYVSMYPILAFPMAFLLSELYQRKKKTGFAVVTSMLLILTVYQVFQTRQFRSHAIHWSGATREAYFENFLKPRPTSASWKMLEMPDFNLAREGIYVSYPTSEDPEEWKALGMEVGKEKILTEIETDRKLQKEIERFAKREEITRDSAYQFVLTRMYERKAKL